MQNNLIEEVMAAEIFLFEYGPRGSLGNVLDSIPIEFSRSARQRTAYVTTSDLARPRPSLPPSRPGP